MEKRISIDIEGMTCINCARSIEKYLEKKGAEEIKVDFLSGDANFIMTSYNRKEVAQEIENLGYHVKEQTHAHHGHSHSHEGGSKIEKLFLVCLIFTLPLFLHMFLPFDWLHHAWVQLVLCLPVFFLGMKHFGKSAWSSVKSGTPNMDVLISIGATSAFIYSLSGMFLFYGTPELHNYLYFETSATIITLVLLGNVLEHRSVKQTTSALGELKKLQQSRAKKVKQNADGQWALMAEVPYEDILVGDQIQVNTGDRIPVDGVLEWGSGLVDESMISGESMPLEKRMNSTLIGGTILLNGNLIMKATLIGKDTLLSKIIDMVKNAQHAKPEIQKIGDKVSAIFVPVVLGISALSFMISFFILNKAISTCLMNSIAVLVISCPCAMGLATPTAVMVGIGLAARKGILIKGGDTLEAFAQVKTIVFDKTGTLTNGKFKIKSIKLFGCQIEEVHEVLFQLEKHSSHPIAKSIVEELGKEENLPKALHLVEIHEEKGMGIQGKDSNGNFYEAGSYLMGAQYTDDTSGTLYVMKNKELKAIVYMEDEITQNAYETIQQLKSLNIHTVLLSGDREDRCMEVAKILGIEEVYAQKLPAEKLEILKKISQKGRVAMVGDGINDAPALSAADVGISMGNATEIAIQSAKIILLKPDDLSSLYKALQYSKHTLITIRQNLFWALIYNVVAIPIAAAGFLNPMLAAFSMAFSDVVVVGNSLRLKVKNIF